MLRTACTESGLATGRTAAIGSRSHRTTRASAVPSALPTPASTTQPTDTASATDLLKSPRLGGLLSLGVEWTEALLLGPAETPLLFPMPDEAQDVGAVAAKPPESIA